MSLLATDWDEMQVKKRKQNVYSSRPASQASFLALTRSIRCSFVSFFGWYFLLASFHFARSFFSVIWGEGSSLMAW